MTAALGTILDEEGGDRVGLLARQRAVVDELLQRLAEPHTGFGPDVQFGGRRRRLPSSRR